MLTLRPLRLDDEAPLARAIASFRASDPEWELVFDRRAGEPFAAYAARLEGWTRGEVPDGRVATTFLLALVDEEIVGHVSIRHALNERLRRVGGHIGYGVVPAHRRKGYASEMLRLSILHARALGLGELLLTCDDDNTASQRTIEKNGGVLTDRIAMPTGVLKRHYVVR